MGPSYFVIAILGCSDGSAACTPVATMPTRYASEAQCVAATEQALVRNSGFDFPTIAAECRAVKAPEAAEREQIRAISASSRRG